MGLILTCGGTWKRVSGDLVLLLSGGGWWWWVSGALLEWDPWMMVAWVLGLLSCAVGWYGEPCCGLLVGRSERKWRKRVLGHLGRGEYIGLGGWGGMGNGDWYAVVGFNWDRDLCGEWRDLMLLCSNMRRGRRTWELGGLSCV